MIAHFGPWRLCKPLRALRHVLMCKRLWALKHSAGLQVNVGAVARRRRPSGGRGCAHFGYDALSGSGVD